jgi:hypothetical protein
LNGRIGGPQIGSGCFGKEKNLLPPSVTETTYRPESSILTTLTTDRPESNIFTRLTTDRPESRILTRLTTDRPESSILTTLTTPFQSVYSMIIFSLPFRDYQNLQKNLMCFCEERNGVRINMNAESCESKTERRRQAYSSREADLLLELSTEQQLLTFFGMGSDRIFLQSTATLTVIFGGFLIYSQHTFLLGN